MNWFSSPAFHTSEQKKERRRACLAYRASLSAADRARRDAALVSAICSHPAYRQASTVLLYYPIQTEPNLLAVAEAAWRDRKQVGFPICHPDSCRLDFVAVSSLSELISGAYGIPEPSPLACPLDGEALTHALCVLPALALDRHGFRLGYGKGYYDRFLSRFSGVSLCAVYSPLLFDTLPTEPTDRAVAWILTEKEVRRPNGTNTAAKDEQA